MNNNTAVNTARPRLITWAGYVALVCLILLPLAVLIVRAGQWQPGLGLYALASLGSVLVLLISVIQLLLPKLGNWRGAIGKNLLFALPGAVLLFSTLGTRGSLPPIHDISTDTDNPPQFVAAAKERGPDANSLAIKPDFIEQQKAAYADLGPQRSVLSADEAFTRALEIASQLGWRVYHENRSTGVIEAVDTTGIMGFKDDIVIRIRSSATGSQLDLRSVSRVGVGDLGANAERIKAFQSAFSQ
ncbi:MAG: DUF1499 domain-containing protein [Halioglobus sp.]